MSRAILLLALSSVTLAASCDVYETSLPITVADVPGTYEADFLPVGQVARLVVMSDSSYVHEYESGDGQTFADSGIWSFYDPGHPGEYKVGFYDFTTRYPTSGRCYWVSAPDVAVKTHPKVWLWIKKRPNEMFIRYCPEPRQRYVRMNK